MIAADGELSVRRQSVGGPVVRVAEHPAGWLRGAHRVILLVHGYNNSQCEACAAFRQFLDHLPYGLGRVGRFFWPGDADFGFFQWLDFLSYPTEIPDAKHSARRLAEFLSASARTHPVTEFVLVGHSLGCRLILEMLDLFAAGAVAPRPSIALIQLMAAAVPVELVRKGRPLRRAGNIVRERVVLYSPHDLVLRGAFPPGQALARAMGHEPEVYLEAVGLNGNPPDFPTQSPWQAFGNGHGDYWKDTEIADNFARRLGVAVPRRQSDRYLPERVAVLPRVTPERTRRSRSLAGGSWSVCGSCT